MPRLPNPGSDAGTWGTILNDYLSQSLNSDGTLKDGVVTKADVGLGNVDDTSDANKPISTATQTALDTKLTASNNLGDVASAATSRTNLGLGTSATRNVGTTAGTVAAGDDSRFVTVPPTGIAATDTAALQAAHDALPSSGGEIRLERGTYAVTAGGFVITKTVRITGAGPAARPSAQEILAGVVPTTLTTIQCAGSTGNAITVQSAGSVFEDFHLVNTSSTTPTDGAGIAVTAKGACTRYRNVSARGFYRCIDVVKGHEWFMSDCFLWDFVRSGLRIQNTDLPDGGDMGIVNCEFIAGPVNLTPSSAVEWVSGGGMRFIGNKINKAAGTLTLGVYLHPADGISTSVFTFVGNSFENSSYGIYSDDTGNAGTGWVAKLVIGDNEFYTTHQCIAFARAQTNKLEQITITGNVFSRNAAAGNAITLGNVSNILVGSNVLGSNTNSLMVKNSGITNLRTISEVKTGSTNATAGTVTLNGSTGVVVSTTAVTASSIILLTQQVPGGTQSGIAYVTARTAGVSFTVASVAGDTSTVGWYIVEPL